MGIIDDDAKRVKVAFKDDTPQAIIVCKDGSIHAHPTNSLAWLINKSETAGKEGFGWSMKYRGPNVSSKWNKKSGTNYEVTDGTITKDVDISKVSAVAIG